jgi:hypothetical protein
MVLMTVTITPLLGVPGGGEQLLVHVGGLKFQVVPHWTVLLVAQSRVKAQAGSGLTAKFTAHVEICPVPRSVTLILMVCEPGPTGVPAAGLWLQDSTGGGTTVVW